MVPTNKIPTPLAAKPGQRRNALPVCHFQPQPRPKVMGSSGAVPAPGKSPRAASLSFFLLSRAGCRRRVIALNYATAAGPLFSRSSQQLAQGEFLPYFPAAATSDSKV